MTAGRQVVDPVHQEKLGYIMIDVKSASFSAIYKQNNEASTEQFFLLDKEGYTIFSNQDKEKIGTKLNIPFFRQSTERRQRII